jgi:hypothetical protein
MEGMTVNKHLMRRYLLATLVAVVVGLVGIFARYSYYTESVNDFTPAEIDRRILSIPSFVNSGRLNEWRINAQLWHFFGILLNYNDEAKLLGNIFVTSTLLAPFAVYTFDVVAASRRKREQGAA